MHQIEEIAAVVIVLKDQLVSTTLDHNVIVTKFGQYAGNASHRSPPFRDSNSYSIQKEGNEKAEPPNKDERFGER